MLRAAQENIQSRHKREAEKMIRPGLSARATNMNSTRAIRPDPRTCDSGGFHRIDTAERRLARSLERSQVLIGADLRQSFAPHIRLVLLCFVPLYRCLQCAVYIPPRLPAESRFCLGTIQPQKMSFMRMWAVVNSPHHRRAPKLTHTFNDCQDRQRIGLIGTKIPAFGIHCRLAI